jgi:predicted nucleotidyltransferase
MENKTINLSVVAEVAIALQELKEKMVFVGGAVISLYTDDPAADEIRPTGDVDMTVSVMSYNNWTLLNDRLSQLGIYPDPEGHAICSYKYKDIPLDIMPAEDSPIGPANKWYKIGFENIQIAQVKDQEIQILSAPCFLATKFEAFNHRGKDYRTSHDIEDIIYLIDNRINIVQETKSSNREIIHFLQDEFEKIKKSGLFEEVLSAHIHPLIIQERQEIVIKKINEILAIKEVKTKFEKL